MYNDDSRNAILKLLMLGLVMPDFHSQPSSNTPTKHSQPKKCGFSDTPFGLLGFPLVNAVHEESDHVDDSKVDKDDM